MLWVYMKKNILIENKLKYINKMDNSERFKVIQELNEFLDISTKRQRIRLGKLIFKTFSDKMTDKGGGISVNINLIPTEFLRELIDANDTDDTDDSDPEIEFWQTLKTE